MSWFGNRNQAGSGDLAVDMAWHAAMRHAQGGPLRDRLSIDQRHHDGLSVAQRDEWRFKGDVWGVRRGNLFILTAPALMKAQLSRGSMTFQQSIDNGPDKEPIRKLLRGDSPDKLEPRIKKLLQGYSSGTIKDVTDCLREGSFTGLELQRILDGRR